LLVCNWTSSQQCQRSSTNKCIVSTSEGNNNYLSSNRGVMFDYSKNLIITGGTFTVIRGGSKATLDLLAEKSAPGAFHCSQERSDPPKCLAETRVFVIDNIMEQIDAVVVSCII
ncbi:hypothetical protein CPB83DRAFT_942961, partial [Crepidotus variabilis]